MAKTISCPNNPFIKTRSLKSRGLAPMETSDGSGQNGFYTKHLMANIKVPGLSVE